MIDPAKLRAMAIASMNEQARQAAAVEAQRRAMIAATPVNSARAMPIAPYQGGGAVVPIPTEARTVEPLTPEQQAIVDAFWDEQDRWTAKDEQGRTVHTPTRMTAMPLGRGEARGQREVAAADIQDQIAADTARRTKAVKRREAT